MNAREKIAILTMIVFSLGALFPTSHISAGEVEVPEPSIGDFHINLKNRTSTYFGELWINGTCTGAADQVNVTVDVMNNTSRMETFWVEPFDFKLLDNEAYLKGVGNISDPWSRWSMHVIFEVPKFEDPGMYAEWLSILGADMPEMDMDQIANYTDMDSSQIRNELENITLILKVRALSGNETYGEDEMDITDRVIRAISSLLDLETTREEPEPDDTTEETEEGEGPIPIWVIILLIALGIVIILVMMALLMISIRKQRS